MVKNIAIGRGGHHLPLTPQETSHVFNFAVGAHNDGYLMRRYTGGHLRGDGAHEPVILDCLVVKRSLLHCCSIDRSGRKWYAQVHEWPLLDRHQAVCCIKHWLP